MSKKLNLKGMRFGKIVVVRDSGKSTASGSVVWIVKCDCGNTREYSRKSLRNGDNKSCGCLRRRDYGVASFNRLYGNYQHQAKTRGLIFSLSKEEFKKITGKNCYYCGIGPSNYIRKDKRFGGYKYNGIDRVDNTIGYIKDNIVPCCKMCNIAKYNNSQEVFTDWIERAYFTLKDKGFYDNQKLELF